AADDCLGRLCRGGSAARAVESSVDPFDAAVGARHALPKSPGVRVVRSGQQERPGFPNWLLRRKPERVPGWHPILELRVELPSKLTSAATPRCQRRQPAGEASLDRLLGGLSQRVVARV